MSRPDAKVSSALRPLGKLIGCKVSAADGKLGRIDDFCFDDSAWIVRYFHIDTGSWLRDRQILISPAAIKDVDWDRRKLSVPLMIDKIEAGPYIEAGRPVPPRQEKALVEHFGWMPYWGPAKGAPVEGVGGVARQSETPPSQPAHAGRTQPDGRPMLRRFKELVAFGVQAKGSGDVKIIDAVVDIPSWIICKLVIKMRKWLLGGTATVALAWIDRIDWDRGQAHVSLTAEEIRTGRGSDPPSRSTGQRDACPVPCRSRALRGVQGAPGERLR